MDEWLKIPEIPEEEKTPIVLLLLEIIKNQNTIIQELKLKLLERARGQNFQ